MGCSLELEQEREREREREQEREQEQIMSPTLTLPSCILRVTVGCPDGRMRDPISARAYAWELGWQCAVRCRPKANPYRLLSREYHSWESGWEIGTHARM